MKFRVITDHPLALDSEDFTSPGGCMHDVSRNHKFNKKLYDLLKPRPLTISDWGCAGAGFVRDLVDDGHIAIGIEGSDYNLHWDGPGGTEAERAKRKPGKRAEWANIPDNLFTADITRPFLILHHDFTPLYCDAITMFEVAEHLPAERYPTVCQNAHRHLRPEGLWIMSVSTQVGQYHCTIRPRSWWLQMFEQNGFVNDQSLVEYFDRDWIRGFDANTPESFHLVLRRNKEDA